jgi:hypothetical protein
MTAAPYASPTRRIVVTGALVLLFLVLGVWAALEYGLGPAVFLLALGAVAAVDLVQVVRRDARRRRRAAG